MNIIKYRNASKIFSSLEERMEEQYEILKERKDFNGMVEVCSLDTSNQIDKQIVVLLNLMAEDIDAKVEAYAVLYNKKQILTMYKMTKVFDNSLKLK